MHFNCILYCTVNVLCDKLVYCSFFSLSTKVSDFGHFCMKKKKKNHISLSREMFWEFCNRVLDAVLKQILASL